MNNDKPEEKKKKTITTTIVCQFCGKTQEVTVEIPEDTDTPKMVWND